MLATYLGESRDKVITAQGRGERRKRRRVTRDLRMVVSFSHVDFHVGSSDLFGSGDEIFREKLSFCVEIVSGSLCHDESVAIHW